MLVKLADSVLNGMELRNISAVLLMDLSAALDTVNHSILLETFDKYYGINGQVSAWLKSYLSERSFYVSIDKCLSEDKLLTLSVPQGGCGSAFYFIMYAATLFSCIPDDINLFGFADDHVLEKSFSSTSSKDELKTIKLLEDTLIDVQQWMNATKLRMNPDKTEFIYFGSKAQLSNSRINTVDVCGDKIKISNSVTYLGAFLDETLSFKSHVNKKCQAAMINFVKIRKIRQFLSQEACATLVLGLIMSHLDYANALLCSAQKTTIQPFQQIQNMCAKLVLKRSKYESSQKALRDLHWLPIQARIEFGPEYLKELLTRKTVTRSLRTNTDDQNNFVIPFNKHKTLGDRSFSYCGPRLWNSLPNEIKRIQQYSCFKQRCKTFLFRKYFKMFYNYLLYMCVYL